jgi:hypothetical protein
LELWGVGHRKRRTIDEERAMSAPKALCVGVRDESLDHPTRHALEDRQGQTGSRLTVRRGGERATGQQRDVVESRVAVKYLDDKPVDEGDRVQGTVPQEVTILAVASVEDGFVVEPAGEVL